MNILIPEDYKPEEEAVGPAVVTYIGVSEALCLEPYACRQREHLAFSPFTEEQSRAAQTIQIRAHEETTGGRDVLGFAHWLSGMGAATGLPLIFKETFEHTGTRIWDGAWLHRTWALRNPSVFRGRSVVELGAGCGLLGVSVACHCGPTSVTMTDFRGHFESSHTVMDLLRDNVAGNLAKVAPGTTVRVLELDWSQPTEPTEWPVLGPDEELSGSCAQVKSSKVDEKRPGLCAPCDVLIGTEIVYSTEGALLLAALLPKWLAHPYGTAYVLNNAKRTGVAEFAAACLERGLSCDEIAYDKCAAATCTLAGQGSIAHDAYVHFRVAWQQQAVELAG